MQRKIMEYLKNWKNSEYRKPLILQGARQVGKTYSILEFGRNYYENVVYFNFESTPKLISTFEEDISPKYLIPILSHIAGQTIIKEKTLIIFDEVQKCERALTSLKYFYEEAPEYHVIVAGSLLGVAVNREEFSFPVGKVDIKIMYPMDIEEFIYLNGADVILENGDTVEYLVEVKNYSLTHVMNCKLDVYLPMAIENEITIQSVYEVYENGAWQIRDNFLSDKINKVDATTLTEEWGCYILNSKEWHYEDYRY